MRVGDIMTRSVVTTTPTISVKDAAVVLAGHGVTLLLPVIDETDRLVGVLTEADVVRRRIPPDPRRGAGQPGRTAAAHYRRRGDEQPPADRAPRD